MIVRIFEVDVFEDKVEEFRKFFTETALPLVKKQPGLVSVTAGLPRAESPTEFSMVMVWANVAALRAFAGEDWQQPHILPDEADLIRERRITHYDMAPPL